jgi:hypothetical protein
VRCRQACFSLTYLRTTAGRQLANLAFTTVAHAAPRAQRQIAKVLAVDHERADVAAAAIEIDETRHGVGVRSTPAGQKMRAFFELGDLRGAAVTTASAGNADSVVSRPSVYSGSDDKVIEAASDATIERALFLIRSTDGVSLTRTPSSTKARWALLANATKKGAASSLVAAVKQKSDSVKLKRSLSHRRAQAEKLKKKITYCISVTNT